MSEATVLPDMLFEEGHYALPRILRGCRIIRAPRIVEERMPGAGVYFDVVRDIVAV